MMRTKHLLMIVAAVLSAAPLEAQLGLPALPLPGAPDLVRPVGTTLESLDTALGERAARLLELRQRTLERLLRDNRPTIEADRLGQPARRGELLLLDPGEAALAQARAAGFAVIEAEKVEGLELVVVRLAVPEGQTLAKAQSQLEALLPGTSISADTLHFTAGHFTAGRAESARQDRSPSPSAAITTPVGVIDGAAFAGAAATRGFAKGAPRPSNHGSAVVSLLVAAGVRTVRVADVYGSDPAGGSALTIARALGWQVESGSKVISISLVGPANPVLASAVAAAQRRGVVIVAPVGNDGPAAPPAFPASYPGVVAVTAVDRRERALIEAGRALHLDYAAPGADLRAADANGKLARVRGTSYAAPLVAARIAAALATPGQWQPQLDAEARDLGQRGTDPTYGRGLVCGTCRVVR